MTGQRDPGRAGLRGAAFVALLGAALGAVLVAAPPAPGPPAEGDARVADRGELRDLIERIRDERGGESEPSAQRRLSGIEVEVPGRTRPRPLLGDAGNARLETIELRARWRACDGAPPVMPHSRNFVATKTCLDCHAEGIWLGQRFGAPLSHQHLTNCTQCHVESTNPALPPPPEPLENAFAGRQASGGGARASDVAPPVMPHPTMMRTRCLSCHGPESYGGIRTDHPQRLNCMQCHAVAASLDQTSPFFTGNATMRMEPGASGAVPGVQSPR